ncbi:hypothetical protein PA27867_2060 [Cryobacterium arcticum]|uniref:Uncharacterized protein n=1 Tax=Cryobacterium arcticum TaxID=670052 RepID=A0A1B1BK82_9MICO|nr:hypothetical protein PA27867_2060 [Cryobacterium arcticum]
MISAVGARRSLDVWRAYGAHECPQAFGPRRCSLVVMNCIDTGVFEVFLSQPVKY